MQSPLLVSSIFVYNLFMPILELREQDARAVRQRQMMLFEKAKQACEYLRELGASEIYLFGSITRDDFHIHSDVDIAVAGLPFKHIYSVEGKIGDILGTEEFDLVYLEYAKDRLRDRIRQQGLRV